MRASLSGERHEAARSGRIMAAVIRDGFWWGVAAKQPVRGDLEGAHHPAAEAPGPDPERHVPGPDPVL